MRVEAWTLLETQGYDSVLDLGSGIPWRFSSVAPSVVRRVAIDLFAPYLEMAREHLCERIHGDMRQAEALVPAPFPSCTMLIDSLEHIPFGDGTNLLSDLKRLTCKILVFTPNGFHQQEEDATMMGNIYQKHVCGWMPENLEAIGFTVMVDDNHDELGSRIFALWKRSGP